MVCKLDWDLRHLDVDQAFIQAELNTEIFLRLPRGCGEMSGKGSPTQQSPLRAEAEWPLMVQATVVNLSRVWV